MCLSVTRIESILMMYVNHVMIRVGLVSQLTEISVSPVVGPMLLSRVGINVYLYALQELMVIQPSRLVFHV